MKEEEEFYKSKLRIKTFYFLYLKASPSLILNESSHLYCFCIKYKIN